jgi:hypothetical protein
MKRAIFLLFAVAIAISSCCNRHRLEPVSWSEFQEAVELEPLQPPLDVAVTVRTEAGQKITVFQETFETDDRQRWICGPYTAQGNPGGSSMGVYCPFETPNPEILESYIRLGAEFEIARDRETNLRAVERDTVLPAVVPGWDDQDSVPQIYFSVNGRAIGIRPYTTHEGFLERIHIDAPEGRSGSDVTVIAYYSRSASPSAVTQPKKKCIWCGDTQVCSADPGCP